MTDEVKLSPLEHIKADSRYLRSDIAEQLAGPEGGFSSGNTQLLKHHGTYQQDDRDVRARARAAGESGKQYIFLVRTRVPGGQLTGDQLLAELDLCDRFGNGTLRITSRQGLQLHGVVKSDLRAVIREINSVHLTTRGACGDVNRNVMCCPAPYTSDEYQQMQALAQTLANHFAPQTTAYQEIWLQDPDTGERVALDAPPAEEVEPLYGRAYLPRKFKMAIALPHDNCIDLHTHDLGLLAVVDQGRISGYNLLVGGGMGVTPSNKKTFPALSQPFAFVTPDQVVNVAESIVKVQRDFGNRADRKLARLKYLIHAWGIDAFRKRVVETYGQTLAPPLDVAVSGVHDHLGWESQGDGNWCYGLSIDNGRIADVGQRRLKTALRTIADELSAGFRLTAYQNVLLTDLSDDRRQRLEQILKEHGVSPSEETSTLRRWAMACVAFPTCGLAITESERVLPEILDQLEQIARDLGIDNEALTIRMTGCPNGCVRPYNADIGLVGKAKGKYTIFLGGSRLGMRMAFEYKNLVPQEELVAELQKLFTYFQQAREGDESFGDFCHRRGAEALATWVGQQSTP